MIPVIEKRDDYVRACVFRLDGIKKDIIILICEIPVEERDNSGDKYRYRLSHFIKTPAQASPYQPSGATANDIEYLMESAIIGFTSYYNDAVKSGHKPSAKWLILNTNI